MHLCVAGDAAQTLRERARSMAKIHLADRRLSDLEMIGCGAFSPLDGFIKRADYDNVVVNNTSITPSAMAVRASHRV